MEAPLFLSHDSTTPFTLTCSNSESSTFVARREAPVPHSDFVFDKVGGMRALVVKPELERSECGGDSLVSYALAMELKA